MLVTSHANKILIRSSSHKNHIVASRLHSFDTKIMINNDDDYSYMIHTMMSGAHIRGHG
jgi:hypothetical protein